jgi:uncharacterized protein
MTTLILKPTEACNAACVYCEVDRKGWRNAKIMPAEMLERLFERVDEYLRGEPAAQLEIIWHGGEPLLLGPAYFERARDFQDKHCAKTSGRIRHTMQTNLTLLTPDHVAAMRRLGMSSVGTSYDPVLGVRLLKKNDDGTAYNRRFLDAVALLEREGFRWGVICVVTKRSLDRPLDIFRFLTNLAPDGGAMFNPVNVDLAEHGDLAVTGEEFADFLGAIFPEWWAHRDRYPRIEPFRSLTDDLTSPRKECHFCSEGGRCADTHFNLGPDGRWSHCGRAADWGVIDYGTVFDRSIAEVFADPARDDLRRRSAVLHDGECRDCRWWSVCHGGCPLDAYGAAGSFFARTLWCDAKRRLIEQHILPVIGEAAVC